MRRVLILLACGAALFAQNEKVRQTAGVAAAPIAVTKIPLGMLLNLEHGFDGRLISMDAAQPIDMLGGTRGLYLPGYGTVFTTEISLIVTPGISPFRPKYTDQERARIHQQKLAQVPKLVDLMKDLVKVTALTLVSMPDDQRVVYAVRLRYLAEEDTSGLPAQIVVSADKKAATQGDIKTEIE